MLSLPEPLRDHITKQTLALAAAYTFLGVPMLGILGLIAVTLPLEFGQDHQATAPALFAFFGDMIGVFGIGFASFLFGWAILIGLLLLRLPLARLRCDGVLPLTLVAALLGAAFYALGTFAGAATLFSDSSDHSIRLPILAWSAIYGLAYGLILHWLLQRAAKGRLHALG